MPTGQGGTSCTHLDDVTVEPRSDVCEECGSSGPLRVCTRCGHVGCCESRQAHNTAHYRATGHPIIRSMPLGESSFTWCYECNRYLEPSARSCARSSS